MTNRPISIRAEEQMEPLRRIEIDYESLQDHPKYACTKVRNGLGKMANLVNIILERLDRDPHYGPIALNDHEKETVDGPNHLPGGVPAASMNRPWCSTHRVPLLWAFIRLLQAFFSLFLMIIFSVHVDNVRKKHGPENGIANFFIIGSVISIFYTPACAVIRFNRPWSPWYRKLAPIILINDFLAFCFHIVVLAVFSTLVQTPSVYGWRWNQLRFVPTTWLPFTIISMILYLITTLMALYLAASSSCEHHPAGGQHCAFNFGFSKHWERFRERLREDRAHRDQLYQIMEGILDGRLELVVVRAAGVRDVDASVTSTSAQALTGNTPPSPPEISDPAIKQSKFQLVAQIETSAQSCCRKCGDMDATPPSNIYAATAAQPQIQFITTRGEDECDDEKMALLKEQN
ncbi:hypothetical protein BDZ91DRAFT_270257 [Kalaharituber pfeilii]|nr:hypothetical protein BDZ91DRAFT_270257 [Kalaharituber pfeilii]